MESLSTRIKEILQLPLSTYEIEFMLDELSNETLVDITNRFLIPNKEQLTSLNKLKMFLETRVQQRMLGFKIDELLPLHHQKELFEIGLKLIKSSSN